MVKSHENRTNRNTKYYMEVKPVRVKITLACTECKQRNYDTTKEKRNHPDRMETKKYCRFCRQHTMHKETKEVLVNMQAMLVTVGGSYGRFRKQRSITERSSCRK